MDRVGKKSTRQVRPQKSCRNRAQRRNCPFFRVQYSHHCDSAADTDQRTRKAGSESSHHVDNYERNDSYSQSWEMCSWKLRDKICNPQKKTRISADRKSAQFSELTADNRQCHSVEKPDQDWTGKKISNSAQT